MNKHSKPVHLRLTNKLGKGGEATIYHIAKYRNLVAKIYHHPTPAREAKLWAMLLNPPKQHDTHGTIAWPTRLVYQQDSKMMAVTVPDQLRTTNPGQFVGFLMPKITSNYSIFHIYNPVMRQQLPYRLDWQTLHRIAYNLCLMVEAIHVKGYVIGDLNESNILVNRKALVTIVDCDSFQVMDNSGSIHRCQVGKPEFTPPELQRVSFREIDQSPEHDLFGLGVLLFQLLMEGYHPFAGVLDSSVSVGRVDLYAIQQGLFPYDRASKITPPPSAPNFDRLHPQLQQLFKRCFQSGYIRPDLRPSGQHWQTALRAALKQLVKCKNAHLYSQHLPQCPYCPKPVSFPPHQPDLKETDSNAKKPYPLQQMTNLFKRIRKPIAIKLVNRKAKQIMPEIHEAYQQGKRYTMITLLAPLIDSDTTVPEVYQYRAWVAVTERTYQQAVVYGLQAIDLGSKKPDPYLIIGRSYVHLKQFDKALRYINTALDKNYSPLQEALYYRAKCYEQLDRPLKVLRMEWEKVLSLDPTTFWGKGAEHALEILGWQINFMFPSRYLAQRLNLTKDYTERIIILFTSFEFLPVLLFPLIVLSLLIESSDPYLIRRVALQELGLSFAVTFSATCVYILSFLHYVKTEKGIATWLSREINWTILMFAYLVFFNLLSLIAYAKEFYIYNIYIDAQFCFIGLILLVSFVIIGIILKLDSA